MCLTNLEEEFQKWLNNFLKENHLDTSDDWQKTLLFSDSITDTNKNE